MRRLIEKLGLMRKLLFTIISISFIGIAVIALIRISSVKTAENDEAFSKLYMKQFHNGMTLNSVREILIKEKNKVEFYNECLKLFQYPMQDCSDGYRLVTTIQLPGNSLFLGKGDLQMYFTFTNKQITSDIMYEVYYPNEH